MVMCFIAGCNNSKNRTAPNKTYSRIPAAIAGLCYDIAKRTDIGTKRTFIASSYKQYRICEDHFGEKDYMTDPKGRKTKLKRSAIPNRHGPSSKINQEVFNAGMIVCMFAGCSSNSRLKNLTFHSVPIGNISLTRLWLQRSKRTDLCVNDVLKGFFAVCSKHFTTSQLMAGTNGMPEIKPGEFPKWSTKDTSSNQDTTTPSLRWKKIQGCTGPLPKPRHGHRAVTVKDLILVFGGGNAGLFEELHVFNTVTLQWFIPAVKGELPPALAAHGMATDGGTKVMICCGMQEYGRYGSEVYELQASRWEWKKMKVKNPANDEPPLPRIGHSFTYHQQRLYLFGGLANETDDPKVNVPQYLDDLYILVLTGHSSAKWAKPIIVGTPPSPRESHTANIYTKSRSESYLVIYGGMDGTRLGDLHFLNISGEQPFWTKPVAHGCVPSPRSLHTAEIINDRLYIFGGWTPLLTDEGEQWKVSNKVACFNLGRYTWEEVSLGPAEDCCPQPRAGHCSTSVNSRIYIWSGRDGYKRVNDEQVCFKDLWCLETAKPPTPSVIQLVEANNNSLEVCWGDIPTAEAYLLQIKRYDLPTADKTNSEDKFMNLFANKPSPPAIVKDGATGPTKPQLGVSTASATGEAGATDLIPSNRPIVKVIRKIINPPDSPPPIKKPKIISIVKSGQCGVSLTPINEEQLTKNLPEGAKLVRLPNLRLQEPAVCSDTAEQGETLAPNTLPNSAPLTTKPVQEMKEDISAEVDQTLPISDARSSLGADSSSAFIDPEASDERQSDEPLVKTWPWRDVAVMKGTSAIVSHYHDPDNVTDDSQGDSVVQLTSGQAYKLRVAAINPCGRSKWSPISAFRTCEPGYPSVPNSVKIMRHGTGAHLTWDQPSQPNGIILAYAVYMAVKSSISAVKSSLPKLNHRLPFSRIYLGCPTMCMVSAATLADAHVEHNINDGGKSSLIFRVAAKNGRGYGAAVQVRWLQDSQPRPEVKKPQAMLTLETTQTSALTPSTTLQLTPAVVDKTGRLILKGNRVTTKSEDVAGQETGSKAPNVT